MLQIIFAHADVTQRKSVLHVGVNSRIQLTAMAITECARMNKKENAPEFRCEAQLALNVFLPFYTFLTCWLGWPPSRDDMHTMSRQCTSCPLNLGTVAIVL
jgi:hypothetical protein